LCDGNGKFLDSKTITIEIASNHKYYPPVGRCSTSRYWDSSGQKFLQVFYSGYTFFRELGLPIGHLQLTCQGQPFDNMDGHTFSEQSYTMNYEDLEPYFRLRISDGITTKVF
jgi:hypothetical protein